MVSSLINGDVDMIGTCIELNPERFTVIDYTFPVGEHYLVSQLCA
jgi:hypothetical protein